MDICGIYVPHDVLLVLGKGLFTVSMFYGGALAATCRSLAEVLRGLCSEAQHQLCWYGTDGLPGILFAGTAPIAGSAYSLPRDAATSWHICIDGHPRWTRGLLGVGICDVDGFISRGWGLSPSTGLLFEVTSDYVSHSRAYARSHLLEVLPVNLACGSKVDIKIIWDGAAAVLGFAANGGAPVPACSPHIPAEQLQQVVPFMAFAEGDPEKLIFGTRSADDWPVYITTAPGLMPPPLYPPPPMAHSPLDGAAVDGLSDGVDNTVAHAPRVFGVLQMVERAGRGLPFIGSSASDVAASLALGTVEVYNVILSLCSHRLVYVAHQEPADAHGSLFRAHLQGDVASRFVRPNGWVEYTFRWSASMQPMDLSAAESE